jgi:ribosomal protein S12 methylthiotransferase accessory factor
VAITTTYLNERLELLDGVYGSERRAELAALGRLYNRFLGPVTAVNIHRPDLFDLAMYSSSGTHSTVGRLMRDLTVKAGIADSIYIPGGGKGGSMRQPFLGALGELAERLLAVLHFAAVVRDSVVASYEDLTRQGRQALGPDDLPLFAAEQYSRPGFPYEPFRPETHLRWIEGIDLLTEQPILVPAQLVLIYYKHQPGEAHIGYPTTGGLAFHHDRRRALLHGIYEYVERDAINVRWYCRLPPYCVDVDLEEFLVRVCEVRRPSAGSGDLFG